MLRELSGGEIQGQALSEETTASHFKTKERCESLDLEISEDRMELTSRHTAVKVRQTRKSIRNAGQSDKSKEASASEPCSERQWGSIFSILKVCPGF